jgi:hypothetical protein
VQISARVAKRIGAGHDGVKEVGSLVRRDVRRSVWADVKREDQQSARLEDTQKLSCDVAVAVGVLKNGNADDGVDRAVGEIEPADVPGPERNWCTGPLRDRAEGLVQSAIEVCAQDIGAQLIGDEEGKERKAAARVKDVKRGPPKCESFELPEDEWILPSSAPLAQWVRDPRAAELAELVAVCGEKRIGEAAHERELTRLTESLVVDQARDPLWQLKHLSILDRKI